jgi:hypothetical protein
MAGEKNYALPRIAAIDFVAILFLPPRLRGAEIKLKQIFRPGLLILRASASRRLIPKS